MSHAVHARSRRSVANRLIVENKVVLPGWLAGRGPPVALLDPSGCPSRPAGLGLGAPTSLGRVLG